MPRSFVLGLCLIAAAAACSRVADSRLNPLNWFGGGQETRTVSADQSVVASANLVAQVLTLRVERVPGGAIVRATGLPPRQGYYDAELVPLNSERPENGVLSYQFEISPPITQTAVGPQRSREVVVARFVSDQTLAGVRSIRVSGANNALAARR